MSSFFVTTAFADEAVTGPTSNFDPNSVEDKCAQLSATDLLEGGVDEYGNEQTLEDYMNRMKDNPYAYETHADLIYRIIPIELFVNACEYFHRGIEYSFYIRTKVDSWGGKMISEVFIIDNVFSIDMLTNTARIKLQTYAATYATISHPNPAVGIVTQRLFDDTEWEYSLHNVKFYAGLMNEHTLNKNDVGYDMQSDVGSVITQTRLNYTELKRSETNSAEPLFTQMFSIAIGYIPYVGDVIGYIEDAVDLAVAIGECHVVNVEYVVHDNEDNIFDFATRENQPEVYGEYLKFAFVKPQNDNVLASDYAELIAKFSHTENATRIVMGVYYDLSIFKLYDGYQYLYFDGNKCNAQDYYSSTDKSGYKQFNTQFSQVVFQKQEKATEGDNYGYLLTEDSEQVFKFVPNKNGDYVIDVNDEKKVYYTYNNAEHNTNLVYGAQKEDEILIYVRNSAQSNNLGRYSLNIRFNPDSIQVGQTGNKIIERGETEYWGFTPQNSGVYSLSAVGDNIRLFAVRADDEDEVLAEGYGALDVYLEGGVYYYFGVQNNGSADCDVAASLNAGKVINRGDVISATVSDSVIYTVNVAHNGDYTFSISAAQPVSVILKDKSSFTINQFDGKVIEALQFLKAGVYYVYFETDDTYVSAQIGYNFTPSIICEPNVAVENISDYNIYKFIAPVSGRYDFTILQDDSCAISVYDGYGNDGVVDYVQGETYFVKVHSDGNDSVLTTVLLPTGQISHNSSYTVVGGANAVTFTPTISGNYTFDGLTDCVVMDENWNSVSKYSQFISENTYYLCFFSSGAADTVTAFFAPPALSIGGGIQVKDTSYYMLNVATDGKFDFTLSTEAPTKWSIYLYDVDLNELNRSTDGNGALSVSLVVGKYYVRVVKENNYPHILKVTSNVPDNNVKGCGVGGEYSYTFKGDYEVVTYKLNYNNDDADQKIYHLITNKYIVEASEVSVRVYYYDNVNVIHEISLYHVVESEYECEYAFVYNKSFGECYIEVTSCIAKYFKFEVTIPKQVQGVKINNSDIANFGNVLVIGNSYRVDLNVLDEDIDGGKIVLSVVGGDRGIKLENGVLTVPFNTELDGVVVKLRFSGNLGNEVVEHSFTVKLPYYAQASISGTDYTLKFTDAYGKIINPGTAITSISTYYKRPDGTKIVLSNKNEVVSLVRVLTVNKISICTDITFKYDNSSYAVNATAKYDASSAVVFLDFSGNAATLSGVYSVGAQVKVLNIEGTAVNSFGISIKERSTDLYINLINCDFSCSTSRAIYAAGTGTVRINVAGACVIRSNKSKTNAIEANNIVISGTTISKDYSTLKVYGGSYVGACTANTVSGTGLVAKNVTVDNVALTVYGGNAELNGCVMTAGDGISADKLSVVNSVLQSYGGNGTFVLKNKGYTGAVGGNGITISSINVSGGSRVSFYGGEGGKGDTGERGADGNNGGNGSAGKTGGTGGDGGLAVNMIKKDGLTPFTKDSTSTVSFFGGVGGNGGNGGNGGKGSNGVSSVNSGKGGVGGRGGNGGVYGQGGKACQYVFAGVQAVDGLTGYGGVGGYGGSGGNGVGKGNGGNGGNGGDSYFVAYSSSGGNGGTGSKNGTNGKSGYVIPGGSIYQAYHGTNASYRYTFYSYTPVNVTIYTSGSTPGNPYLELYDNQGKLLASDDDGNGAPHAKISHFIAPGVKYTIVVAIQGSYAQFGLYVK
ncbi:MAG: hypothetical protein K2F90_02960 [Clostridiales bacterium]|nr:hypothetical protein [Clostridiales bacterium]